MPKMKTDTAKYALNLRILHWLIAILIIGLLIVGLWMEGLGADPIRPQVYMLHKSFGIVVLALVVARIAARLKNGKPPFTQPITKWEKVLISGVEYLLYAGMLLMPLSGFLMSSFGGHPVSLFNLWTIPFPFEKDPELGKLFRMIHGYIGYAMIGLIGLHVAGFLKHLVIDKVNLLRRMF